MREIHDVDLDYHVRHSALPHPGGQRELGILVSRLHSNALDLHRPLWEAHLIEGLQGNRFAMYTKTHHSLIDGVSSQRLMMRALATGPDRRDMPPFWGVGAGSGPVTSHRDNGSSGRSAARWSCSARAPPRSAACPAPPSTSLGRRSIAVPCRPPTALPGRHSTARSRVSAASPPSSTSSIAADDGTPAADCT